MSTQLKVLNGSWFLSVNWITVWRETSVEYRILNSISPYLLTREIEFHPFLTFGLVEILRITLHLKQFRKQVETLLCLDPVLKKKTRSLMRRLFKDVCLVTESHTKDL